LKVAYGSLGPGLLGSTHAGIKERYRYPEKWSFTVISSFSVKMVADRHRHAAYHSKH